METNLQDRQYLLQDEAAGDFVSKVESTGMETTKLYFHFTKEKAQARRFSYNDLFSPLQTTSIGIEFSRGFSRGRLVRIET